MYDIKNEYEIYTGYFVNFTKGEGTRLKVLFIFILASIKHRKCLKESNLKCYPTQIRN
jgi:hypothetical protein